MMRDDCGGSRGSGSHSDKAAEPSVTDGFGVGGAVAFTSPSTSRVIIAVATSPHRVVKLMLGRGIRYSSSSDPFMQSVPLQSKRASSIFEYAFSASGVLPSPEEQGWGLRGLTLLNQS